MSTPSLPTTTNAEEHHCLPMLINILLFLRCGPCLSLNLSSSSIDVRCLSDPWSLGLPLSPGYSGPHSSSASSLSVLVQAFLDRSAPRRFQQRLDILFNLVWHGQPFVRRYQPRNLPHVPLLFLSCKQSHVACLTQRDPAMPAAPLQQDAGSRCLFHT